MPGENLTRVEAQERAGLVQPSAYEVELDLTRGPEVFGSTTTVRFTGKPGASTFIDAITKTVHAVTLNGRSLDPADVSDGVRIQLPGLEAENELTIVADAMYTNTGEGLHRFVDPVDDEVYLYSQFEVPDSRRMFAVFEQPDLKATFRFAVTAPARWQVVSNQPTPEPDIDGDVATWRFEPTPRLSSYITALIAGPYRVARDELTSADGRTIPLGAFARASLFPHLDADYVFDITKKGFEFFERIFGVPYPFDKYDQLFVPEYNAGAMENAGAVTFAETYVFRSKVSDAVKERRVVTILHELAHMWFGDLVTMKWWNDLWLNESFAEYISTLATADATEWREAWTTFSIMEKSWGYTQDQLPSTHPIVAEIPDLQAVLVNFDGITYAKGASVLKQLDAWVGREAFLEGVGSYFRKHAFGNTELRDLLVELEATSGRDLTSWSASWLETAGVNTLTPEIEVVPDGSAATSLRDASEPAAVGPGNGLITGFAVRQTASEAQPTIRPHRLAIGFYELSAEKLVRTQRFELDIAGERTDVPEAVGTRRPALVLLNDDDLAYAKIRLDEESLESAIAHLSTIESPLARALVWGSVWDATRDAEARPRDFVRLVLNNIGSETESTTLRTVLQQAALAASSYVAPEVREETLVALGDGLLELLRNAEPGSDAQFQFAKNLAALARTEEQLQAVHGLLSGARPIEGLAVDTDLRWELLIALVAGGTAGEAEITATLAADDTATGRESAAHARAAIPTAEGKRAAWSSVVDSAALPNATVRATCLGFRRAADRTLLEPYVDDYFGVIEQLWAGRSYAIGEALARGLFPAPLADRRLVSASQQWLDAHPEPTALRRVIVENAAGVQRALAAQARDARD